MNFLSNLKNAIQEKGTNDNKRKWVKKGDLEQEKRLKIEEEKKKKLEEKEKEWQQLEKKANDDLLSLTTIEEEICTMEISDVKKRLRDRDEPITLFGETDFQREKRLRKIEEQLEEEEGGKQNIFGEILENLESGESGFAKDKLVLKELLPKGESNDKNDILLKFFFELLELWENKLQDRPTEVKSTAQGKREYATFAQSLVYIQPLFSKLKERTLDEEIRNYLFDIQCELKDRNYEKANDVYLRMAIGNAAWPIGVTMVGIHARSAREKISTGTTPHVLNDEVQRKYIQCIKRLMSFHQDVFPK